MRTWMAISLALLGPACKSKEAAQAEVVDQQMQAVEAMAQGFEDMAKRDRERKTLVECPKS